MGQYFYIQNLSKPSTERIFGGKEGEWIWDHVIKKQGWSEFDIIVAFGDGGGEYWYADSKIKYDALNIENLLTLFATKFNLAVPADQMKEFALEYIISLNVCEDDDKNEGVNECEDDDKNEGVNECYCHGCR
jgi:hypothetical protein